MRGLKYLGLFFIEMVDMVCDLGEFMTVGWMELRVEISFG
jgi:hypothetical protein